MGGGVGAGELEGLRAEVAERRRVLRGMRAARVGGWENYEHALDLELTFTSNAIEGNTLTAVETTLVVEKGLTIGGKPLRDHLEAIDHFEALGYVRREHLELGSVLHYAGGTATPRTISSQLSATN